MAEFGSSDCGASLGDILGAAIRRRNQQAQQEPDPAAPRDERWKPICWWTGGASSAACLLARLRGAGGARRRRWSPSPRFGVIERAHVARVAVSGLITEDRKLTEAIDALADDDRVKALIVVDRQSRRQRRRRRERCTTRSRGSPRRSRWSR